MTNPPVRVRLTGRIEVALPPPEAFTLFTPDGERRWAAGWDPEYPGGGTDDSEPGTVFQTRHGDQQTTWAVVRRDPGRLIQYTATTPGDRAGLITVDCQASPGGTGVTVSYDLTALSPEGSAGLGRFAAEYPRFLAHWEQAIAGVTGPG